MTPAPRRAGNSWLPAPGGGQKRRYSSLISFTGRVSDGEIADLFSRAKALLFPGIEDFGIIPVEAAAAGCPVIAFRDGGALDTVKEHVTGLFFEEQNAESLIAAMDRFEQTASQFTDRSRFTAHAEQFSKAVFIKRLGAIINARIRL